MTVEQLMAMGYDRATAEVLAAQTEETSGGLPFSVVKFNYDQKDILVDLGVKKGNLISGWELDTKNFSVKTEGEDLGNELEFYIVSRVYQYSMFNANGELEVQSNLFSSAYDAKKAYDLKTGVKIEQLKAQGKKLTFNQITLMMIKRGNEFKPYIMYMHGTMLYKFNEDLAEKGIKNPVMKYVFKVKSKKVPTKFQPAWVFEILDIKERTEKDLIADVKVLPGIIKQWNDWVESVDTQDENTNTCNAKNDIPTGKVTAVYNEQVEEDLGDEEIPF